MRPSVLRKSWRLAVFLCAAVGVTLIFQNCGAPFESFYNQEYIEMSSRAPAIQLTKFPGPLTSERSVSIDFETTLNPYASVKETLCYLDEAPPVPCAGTFSAEDLVDGDHKVRIVVIDNFNNESAAEFVWRVDGTGPVVNLNLAPAQVSGAREATVEFSAMDGLSGIASIECSLDEAAFAVCQSPLRIDTRDERTYSLKVRARDVAGNVSDEATATWRVDFTAPVLTVAAGPANFTNSRSATFEFSGTDNGEAINNFECRLDGGDFAACMAPMTYANLNDGTHTFGLRGRDAAGNLSEPISRMWVIDTVVPTVQITAAPDATTNSTTATFQFNSADGNGSGISRMECSLDNGNFVSCASPRSYQNLANGSRQFAVRAVDNADNVSMPQSRTWLIDSVAPQISIASSVGTVTTSTSATMTITATDSGTGLKGIECRLDGGAFETCGNTKTYQGLNQGTHTFAARATDVANNQRMATFTWNINTAPTPSPPAPPPVPIPPAPNPPSPTPGAAQDGATISVMAAGGESFGNQGPTLVLYDDFRGGNVGSTHSLTATVGRWSATRGIVYQDGKLPYGRGIRVIGNGQLTSTINFGSTESEFFVSTYGYVPSGYRFPSADSLNSLPSISALKMVWAMYGSDGYSDVAKPDHMFLNYTGATFYRVASNDAGGPSTFDTNGDIGWTFGEPIHFEFWAKGNGTSAQGSDGMFQSVARTSNRMTSVSYRNYKPWFTANHTVKGWDRINLIGYARSSATFPTHNFVMGQVYVAKGAGSAARVEITDNRNYSSSRVISICNVESWSSSKIDVTLRYGAHASSSGPLYLHVFNANNQHTNGGVGRELR